jgi:hypothetical protein
MEPGQLLQLLDDWLATGHEQIGTSLARFTGIDGYGVETLRDDLARFMFLLGETDGEGLFSPRTVELIEPAALPALTPANPVSSARGTFSPAELAEIAPIRNMSPGANDGAGKRVMNLPGPTQQSRA